MRWRSSVLVGAACVVKGTSYGLIPAALLALAIGLLALLGPCDFLPPRRSVSRCWGWR